MTDKNMTATEIMARNARMASREAEAVVRMMHPAIDAVLEGLGGVTSRPPTLAETIAEEIFATIERERRINKGDLVQAVERCLTKAMPYPIKPERRKLSDYYKTPEAAMVAVASDFMIMCEGKDGTLTFFDPDPEIGEAPCIGGPLNGQTMYAVHQIMRYGNGEYRLRADRANYKQGFDLEYHWFPRTA